MKDLSCFHATILTFKFVHATFTCEIRFKSEALFDILNESIEIIQTSLPEEQS